MKHIRLLILLSTLLFALSAQTVFASTTDKPFSALIFEWKEEAPIFVRTFETDNEWSEWYEITDDPDYEANANERLFLTNESSNYEVRTSITDLKVTPLSNEFKKPQASHLEASLFSSEIPRIITRSEWGADESLKIASKEADHKDEDPYIKRTVYTDGFGRPYLWPLEYMNDPKMIVIHHTASVNNLDNPKLAMQNLYTFHTKSTGRGWGDVGYHYIIDPQGNIYSGRFGGDTVVAGHAHGVNRVAIGIAIMGDYDKKEIPTEALRSVLNLTNYLREKHEIDTSGHTEHEGNTYSNISGHRDSSSTTCPGAFLYQKLEGMKTILKAEQSNPRAALFSEIGQRDLVVIQPESSKDFRITLRNTSAFSWPEESKLIESNGGLEASLRGGGVEPGKIGIFEGTVTSSSISGLKASELSLSIPGKILASREKIIVPIVTEGIIGSYEIISRHDPKNSLKAGEIETGWIELRNTGNVTWRKDGDNPLVFEPSEPRGRSSLLFNTKKVATMVQSEVKPGDTGRFNFQVKGPALGGDYTEHVIPVMKNLSDLEGLPIFFKFNVEGRTIMKNGGTRETPQNVLPPTEPIRIKLSFNGAPVIRMRGLSDLFADNKQVKILKPNEMVRIVKSGEPNKLKVFTSSGSIVVDSPVRIVPKLRTSFTITNWHRRPKWNQKLNDNEFRGTFEARLIDNKIISINELPLEDYILGLGEVSNEVAKEKQKAIVTLARTYAQFYMTVAEKFPGMPYHLDDDPNNTQKYVGYSYEKRATEVVKSVRETKGIVVTYNGKLVKTPYFSQSDGRTRSAEEVWGLTNMPYLQSVPDTACSGPLRGHGVGLSGCGAEAMAQEGKGYEEIIKYYYQGVELFGQN